jgi:hypothetical protein
VVHTGKGKDDDGWETPYPVKDRKGLEKYIFTP